MVVLYIDIFKYFIGKDFWDGLVVVPIILSAKLFLGVFYNLSVWYKLTNKTLYGAIIAIIGAFLIVILNVFLIPRYGFIGAAWANFISNLAILVISYLWGRKIYRVNYELKSQPKVSILIPTKNNRLILKRCLESIEKKITPKTKILAITHLSNVTGAILPIKEIIQFIDFIESNSKILEQDEKVKHEYAEEFKQLHQTV